VGKALEPTGLPPPTPPSEAGRYPTFQKLQRFDAEGFADGIEMKKSLDIVY